MRPPRAEDCGLGLLKLLEEAVERRDAKRLLDELVVVNRATNASDETWGKKIDELDERMHTGLTRIEAPLRDPNAPKPRPRLPFLHQEKRKCPA